MNILILYSSVTGNTQKLAQAIQSRTHNITCLPIEQVRQINDKIRRSEYDILFLGFWVYRGKPDPRMLRFMQSLKNVRTAVFGTLAAYPDSDHARRCLSAAKDCLHGNTVLGGFLCLGKLTEKRLTQKMQAGSTKHPMTDERKKRLLEGLKHPDTQDCENFQKFFDTVTAAEEQYRKLADTAN